MSIVVEEPSLHTEKIELEWSEPRGYKASKEIEPIIRAALFARIAAACWEVWKPELPPSAQTPFEKAVTKGIRDSVKFLLATREQKVGLAWPSHCWAEPPVADCEPPFLKHELECLRFLSSLIAQAVRDDVETLHANFQTSDARMPLFNQTARNCAYEVLIAHPYEAWRLTWRLRGYFRAEARGEFQFPLNPGLLGRSV